MPTALPPDTDFTNATTQGAAKTAYSGLRAFLAGLLGTTGNASDARGTLGIIEHGQCRLNYVSTTQIKLSPFNGDRIVINGAVKNIPSAGVTLANTGLTAATLYYVYLYDNAGTLALEASTTSHTTDTTAGNVGVEIKTADNSRTYLGTAYMDGGSPGTFADQYIDSWFNPPTNRFGWQVVADVDVGTGATLDFETGFDANYEHEFTFQGVYPAVADYLVARVKEAGAYVTAASSYRATVIGRDNAGVTGFANAYDRAYFNQASTGWTAASEGLCGTIRFFNTYDSGLQTRWYAQNGYGTGSGATSLVYASGAGEREAAATCQGVRFSWNGGNNFSGGRIVHRRRRTGE